jgi:crotonobetainyl-CoA:carnitine CoA-transferase CaiB-like acyl-CoA transferase
LVPLLAAEIVRHPKDWLVAQMEAAGVPGGPINTVPEVLASPQVAARGMVVSVAEPRAASGHVDLIGNPVKFSKTPVTYRHAPPFCGQHNDLLPELTGSGGSD